jgi:hypothetical protein
MGAMENTQNRILVPLVIVLAVIIVGGAIFLFQSKPAVPTPSETASTTEATTTAETSPAMPAKPNPQVSMAPASAGSGTPVVTPASSDFYLSADVSNMKVGGSVPTITVHLAPNSDGKVVMLGLKPTDSQNAVPQQILLVVPVNTEGTTYPISGLRLSTYIDAKSGNKVEITPGSYQLEAVLWDRNPLTVQGTYGDVGGNNATAVLSSAFTISN